MRSRFIVWSSESSSCSRLVNKQPLTTSVCLMSEPQGETKHHPSPPDWRRAGLWSSEQLLSSSSILCQSSRPSDKSPSPAQPLRWESQLHGSGSRALLTAPLTLMCLKNTSTCCLWGAQCFSLNDIWTEQRLFVQS